jgi:hypothetical protein
MASLLLMKLIDYIPTAGHAINPGNAKLLYTGTDNSFNSILRLQKSPPSQPMPNDATKIMSFVSSTSEVCVLSLDTRSKEVHSDRQEMGSQCTIRANVTLYRSHPDFECPYAKIKLVPRTVSCRFCRRCEGYAIVKQITPVPFAE